MILIKEIIYRRQEFFFWGGGGWKDLRADQGSVMREYKKVGGGVGVS